MFRGFLAYAGQEVINVERTMTYIRNGIRPSEFLFRDDPISCDGLGAALGHSPYRTPDLDVPPWYNLADPATHSFAGVLPIDITGMEGSTYTAEVSESLGDGGVVAGARRGSRTIAVTAALVGATEDALHAGLEWLTGALLRRCDDGDVPTLSAFTTCPGPLDDLEDTTAAPVAAAVPLGAPGWTGWDGSYDYAGRFTPAVASGPPPPPPVAYLTEDADGLYLPGGLTEDADGLYHPEPLTPEPGGTGFYLNRDTAVVTTGDTLDGGDATTTPTDLLDGGDATGTPTDVLDGNPPDVSEPPPVPDGRLSGPDSYGCRSRVVVTWTVTAVAGAAATVTRGIGDEDGNWLIDPPPPVAVATSAVTWTDTYDAVPFDDWRPMLGVTGGAVTVTLTVGLRPDVDPDLCLSPYRRTFPQVKCVAPPQVTAEYVPNDPGCTGGIWQVEWQWVVEDPYRYTDPVALVQSYQTAAGVASGTAPGVSVAARGTVTQAATDCPLPTVTNPTCATDPTLPGWIAPPVVPLIGDVAAVTPSAFARYLITLDPLTVPTGGAGALMIRVANDATEKRGLRLRLWPSPDPDFSTVDECDFENEVWVDYLAASSDLIIDTVNGTIAVVCPNGDVADGRSTVRGPYRGSLRFPVVECGARYFIAVDLPSGAGNATVSLSYATREG